MWQKKEAAMTTVRRKIAIGGLVVSTVLANTPSVDVTASLAFQNWYFEQGNPQEVVEVSVDVQIRLEDDETLLASESYSYSSTIDQVPSRAAMAGADGKAFVAQTTGILGQDAEDMIVSWVANNVWPGSPGYGFDRTFAATAAVSPYIGMFLFAGSSFA
jgi:hypothetical protein